MVLPDVQPVLGRPGLLGDPWADHLGEPVDVDRVDIAAGLDLLAHLLRPRLGAEDPDLEGGLSRVDAGAFHLVEDGEEVARGHHDDPRLEVGDELDLAFRHTSGDGDDRAAEPFDPIVRTQPTGEQAVAIGDVDDIAGPPTSDIDRPRHDIGPHLDVGLGVADHRRLARRARRRVDPDDLLAGDREHPVGVVASQVLLGGEGDRGEVGQRLDVVGVQADRVEGCRVVRHVRVGTGQGVLEPPQLDIPQVVEVPGQSGVDIRSHRTSFGGEGRCQTEPAPLRGPTQQAGGHTCAGWPQRDHPAQAGDRRSRRDSGLTRSHPRRAPDGGRAWSARAAGCR